MAWLLFSLPVFSLLGFGQQTLHEHVRPAVSSGQAALVGALPASRRLDLAIMLAPRNEAELNSLISSLYDPFSPQYHQFLSVAQFTELFGPTAADYQAVVAFAQASGLTVRDAAANRMVVSVNGTVSQIEKAFHVSMKMYQHPTENRTFYSPDREPTVAVGVPVLHIEGLDNYSPPRPMAVKAAAGQLQPAAFFSGSGPGNSFLSSDMRAAYYGGTALTGAGQAVGLFEAIGYDINDVSLTFANAGQTYSVPINNVLLDGFINGSGQNDVEPVLDIVQAIGMAPGLSQVRVYLGNNPMDILNSMASENIAKQISISYIWQPGDVSAYELIFKEYASQGQTVFAASGDNGAYTESNTNYYPAEDPYVTAVGGTTLATNGAGGGWASEISWAYSGGGVGFAPYSLAIPNWQSGIATAANGGSATLRNVPDVAMDGAFHNYACQALTCSNGWGGTSFASPRWAGYMALVNEQAEQQGKTTLGFINPTLYSVNQTPSYSSNFHDISDGGNDQCCSQSVFYSAVAGYDLVTGWGTPTGQSLIDTLAGGYTVAASTRSLSVYKGSSASTTISVTDESGFSGGVALSVTGLPGGVTASFSSNPAAASSVLTLTASDSAAPGSYTLTISGLSNGVTETTAVTLKIVAAGASQNPPYVGYVAFWGINNSGVTISWSTDVAANTQLAYGTTSSLGQVTPLQTALSNSHGVVLSGLNSGTTYYFVAQSTGANGLTGYSTVYSFTTTGMASNPAPVISGVTATLITSSSATINWTTDQPSYSQVNYGTNTSYGLSVTNAVLVTNHSVTLTGLTPGTTYNFDVTSGNAQSVSSTSANQTFVTAAGNPVISNVQASVVGPNTAAITWTTDQATTSLVNYGTTAAYGSVSTLNPSLVTSHSVILNGLTGGITYQFDVVSGNSANETVTSQNYSFTTPPVASTPVISSVTVTATTSTTATIGWITDQPTTSQVNYGPTSSYGSSSTIVTTLSTSHLVTLTGLSASTTYNFDVVSANSVNISAASPNGTFTTAASTATPPYVGYVNFWGVTDSGATISWSTDVPANTQLAYGTTTKLGQLTPVQAALTASHGVVLTGLSSGTTYYFVAQSTGANGATGYSSTYSFTTTGMPGGGTPVISNIAASGIGTTSATITWTTDQPTTSLVNYGTATSYGSSSALGTALVTAHSVTLTGLIPATVYNFDVVSANSANVSATSANNTFVTALTGTPVISNVAATSISSTSATVTWTTDQPTNSLVNYGVNTILGAKTPVDNTLVTAHSVTLTSLTPGTRYYFQVESTNSAEVSAVSPESSFSTLTSTGTAPNLSYVASWGITDSGVTISWSTDVPATTALAYGTTAALGQMSPIQSALTLSHGVTLTGLTAGTTYYFVAQSASAGGQTGYSGTNSFTTTGINLPVISGVTAAPGSNNSAVVSWTTSVPTVSYVQFGTTTAYDRYSAETGLTTNPQPAMGYVPSGVIHYQVVSTDASGHQVMSPDYQFTEP